MTLSVLKPGDPLLTLMKKVSLGWRVAAVIDESAVRLGIDQDRAAGHDGAKVLHSRVPRQLLSNLEELEVTERCFHVCHRLNRDISPVMRTVLEPTVEECF